jgi:hypothetical protein
MTRTDFTTRLTELRTLKDGWLEGEGLAPDPAGLDWLAGMFEKCFPDDDPVPYIYPTPEGMVQAEWSFYPNDIGMVIDPKAHRGEMYCLNLKTGKDRVDTLDLDNRADWAWMVNLLRVKRKEQIAGRMGA